MYNAHVAVAIFIASTFLNNALVVTRVPALKSNWVLLLHLLHLRSFPQMQINLRNERHRMGSVSAPEAAIQNPPRHTSSVHMMTAQCSVAMAKIALDTANTASVGNKMDATAMATETTPYHYRKSNANNRIWPALRLSGCSTAGNALGALCESQEDTEQGQLVLNGHPIRSPIASFRSEEANNLIGYIDDQLAKDVQLN